MKVTIMVRTMDNMRVLLLGSLGSTCKPTVLDVRSSMSVQDFQQLGVAGGIRFKGAGFGFGVGIRVLSPHPQPSTVKSLCRIRNPKLQPYPP